MRDGRKEEISESSTDPIVVILKRYFALLPLITHLARGIDHSSDGFFSAEIDDRGIRCDEVLHEVGAGTVGEEVKGGD